MYGAEEEELRYLLVEVKARAQGRGGARLDLDVEVASDDDGAEEKQEHFWTECAGQHKSSKRFGRPSLSQRR